jgi:hypothetical protein
MRRERQLNFAIPEEWHEWLRERAFHERVPIADLVRRALKTTYAELPDPKPDEGSKAGEYAPLNLRTAGSLCDRSPG